MDDILKQLGGAPIPPKLAQIDDAVIAAFVKQQGESRATSQLLSAAAVLALGVGYAGGSLVPASASELALSETALAPSTLLDPL